ncbi:membrane protein YdbS with pleckstrin-like domain [Fontibacillus solani]|uniref:Membrane protein YdbS with pleckstrin-like domain n=1 Tax=Fontibacillus solani TaxID=1572857 RepID=A0A7W3SSW9_9BACL|nr:MULTISPECIES: hypothetical protein [Fontibacillus]MBA9085585.1 membrane protein YdbS with pleckstrin-like domain [Fontibacillus solani]
MKLRFIWAVPLVLLIMINIGLLLFILSNVHGLKELASLELFILMWLFITFTIIFGAYQYFIWIKNKRM